ncbi:MAG TPA: alpha-glucosidase/alpha-galactosidase [bacterium]|nr:alpha-glucosidase/alpha-galactosidase [bacterium]HOL65950.1 alpha-glucosidase/alpha-galactosidase [bacterium]
MAKITFLGAGSTIFAKNILGDVMLTGALKDAEIALYDIDPVRLQESFRMLTTLNRNINAGQARIKTYLGVENRKKALRGASYVVNAVQVGGYDPATINDFEIPKKYGLRQTIGDTLGIGGIFRGLRTIPVMLEIGREMEEVCPDAWLLNYTNPMAIVTGAMLLATGVKTVGLCHSVQVCAEGLLRQLGLWESVKRLRWKIAGINHQAWLIEISDAGKDLYPEIRKRALHLLEKEKAKKENQHHDLVRLEILRNFGYYLTESSEHSAEYVPWFIKSGYPELISRYNIPLDEYPRRCLSQIENWKKMARELVENPTLTHTRTREYGSYIMEAMETNRPIQIGGNVLNQGLVTNLPDKAVVEIPCLVDGNGVQGCYVGDLPEQCAALNRTSINVQILTIQAALTKRKEYVYQAALLDPHTAAELPIDRIRSLCDELLAAHQSFLPKFR